jgi:hypothetical protein
MSITEEARQAIRAGIESYPGPTGRLWTWQSMSCSTKLVSAPVWPGRQGSHANELDPYFRRISYGTIKTDIGWDFGSTGRNWLCQSDPDSCEWLWLRRQGKPKRKKIFVTISTKTKLSFEHQGLISDSFNWKIKGRATLFKNTFEYHYTLYYLMVQTG